MPMASAARHHLFLCIKETLANVHHHAKAANVSVKMACAAETFTIQIRDDGRGLPAGVESSEPGECGNGMSNLRSRITNLGGEFAVRNAASGGVEVQFHVPLNALRAQPLAES
jgi:two-component system sensor histidine kinase DesK